jgi:hypothetical protein
MKQNITTKQLNELSEEGEERLREWIVDHSEYYPDWDAQWPLPLLSIGRMIEFLGDVVIDVDLVDGELNGGGYINETMDDGLQFCDALWEAVKEVLEK